MNDTERKAPRNATRAWTSVNALSEPLASQPFLLGDEFTIADIGDMPYLEHFASTPVQQKLERFPHLLAWWARLRESESWRKIAGRL